MADDSSGLSPDKDSLYQEICQVLSSQHGVLFAQPALVHRAMYTGRGIIARNTEFSPGQVDDRGYVPVEWWIMSQTEAKNAKPLKNEGITSLLVNNRPVLLTEALKVAEVELMGTGFSKQWPLTKVLDIGGLERCPQYSEKCANNSAASPTLDPEAPPIPCHVHSGEVVDGRCVGHGKTEAYFFPPLDVPPYNRELGPVKTRLGLKPGVTKQEVLDGLRKFGESDDLYSLLTEYQISPWESWTIEQKVMHAPGPWPTFEIQLPQDDFNLLAWILGEQLAPQERTDNRHTYQLRGVQNEEELLRETLDWEMNTDPKFQDHWWRKCEVLAEGEWGRVMRLFYHIFYGEGFVIRPGQKYTRDADSRPFAGIIWSGEGYINGLKLDVKDEQHKEFLVAPNHAMELENTVGSQTGEMIVFTVFPFETANN